MLGRRSGAKTEKEYGIVGGLVRWLSQRASALLDQVSFLPLFRESVFVVPLSFFLCFFRCFLYPEGLLKPAYIRGKGTHVKYSLKTKWGTTRNPRDCPL